MFSSINLFSYLKHLGIWAVGTIRSNRLRGVKNKNTLEAEGRGALDYVVDVNSNVVIVRWLDNGIVQLISTFVGPSMGNNITRWSGKETKLIEVECPEIVHQYNKHTGGVDLCDMLMALYRIRLGTKKWYFHIVYYGIGVAVVNG